MSLYFRDLLQRQGLSVEDSSRLLSSQETGQRRKEREKIFPKGRQFHAKKWTTKETNTLLKGMRAMYMKDQLDQIMEKHRTELVYLERMQYIGRKYGYKSKVVSPLLFQSSTDETVWQDNEDASQFLMLENRATWPEELQGLKCDLENLEKQSSKSLEKFCLPNYTPQLSDLWQRISAEHVKSKSAEECYIEWMYHVVPSLKRELKSNSLTDTWNKEEIDKLKQVIEQVKLNNVNNADLCLPPLNFPNFLTGFSDPTDSHKASAQLQENIPSLNTNAETHELLKETNTNFIENSSNEQSINSDISLTNSETLVFHWDLIAQLHGYQRTPIECLRLYQRHLRGRRKWTPQEDELLTFIITNFPPIKGNYWQWIATHFEGRTGQQCLHRWTRCLSGSISHFSKSPLFQQQESTESSPKEITERNSHSQASTLVGPRKKGKWSSDEDRCLQEAIQHIGLAAGWSRIAQCVPGRTDVQCRERYKNILDPSLVRNEQWTMEEDALLLALAPKFEMKWSTIATHIQGRTDNQCARRWKALQKPPKYKVKTREKLNEYIGKVSLPESPVNIPSTPVQIQLSMPSLTSFTQTVTTDVGKKVELPRRRLHQLSGLLHISLDDEFQYASETPIEEEMLPLDSYNVAALLRLWNFLQISDRRTEEIAQTDEYKLLLERFKIIFNWPILLALLPEDSDA